MGQISSKAKPVRKRKKPTQLHLELAANILKFEKEQNAHIGHPMFAVDLAKQFGVSRTPVHSALNLLVHQGFVEQLPNRSFVLKKEIKEVPELGLKTIRDEEEKELFLAIAQARVKGTLPDECTQQELVRRFKVRVEFVIRVLRHLAELGLVERKRGNGWSFLPFINSSATQRESYQLRLIVEPALLLLPSFALDQDWAQKIRARHIAFRKLHWRDTLALEFYEMNADFHEGLARSAGNRYIVNIIQQQNRLRQFSNYSWEYGIKRVQNSIAEHLDILAALQDNKRDFASALMRQHLENARHTHPENHQPPKPPKDDTVCC